jgi:hypothetical protein
VKECTTATGCPKDGLQYHYCSAGGAFQGCRNTTFGIHPPSGCSEQCITTPTCAGHTNCPTQPGSQFFHCRNGDAGTINGCRPYGDGLIPSANCYEQCVVVNDCTAPTLCPLEGDFYFCLGGAEKDGCRAKAQGPFGSSTCQAQCLAKPPPIVVPLFTQCGGLGGNCKEAGGTGGSCSNSTWFRYQCANAGVCTHDSDFW